MRNTPLLALDDLVANAIKDHFRIRLEQKLREQANALIKEVALDFAEDVKAHVKTQPEMLRDEVNVLLSLHINGRKADA